MASYEIADNLKRNNNLIIFVIFDGGLMRF